MEARKVPLGTSQTAFVARRFHTVLQIEQASQKVVGRDLPVLPKVTPGKTASFSSLNRINKERNAHT